MWKLKHKGKITALYERLSHNNGRSDESVSVENQKRILEDYVRKNSFSNIRHFNDDGVRRTTFERPGLDAMVDKIRASNGATVIVKDSGGIIGPNQKGSEKLGISGLAPSLLTEKRTIKTTVVVQVGH